MEGQSATDRESVSLAPEVRVDPDHGALEFVFCRHPRKWGLGKLCILGVFPALIVGGIGQAILHERAELAWLGWCLLGVAALATVGSGMALVLSTLAVDKPSLRLDRESLTVTMYDKEIRFPRSDVVGLQIERSTKGKNTGYLIMTREGSMRVLLEQVDFDMAPMHEALVRELALSETNPVPPVVGWRTFVGLGRWAALIVATAVAVLMGCLFASSRLAAAKTASWPATSGIVLSSQAGREHDTYYADIKYKYSVGDRSFQSERISFTHTASDGAVRQLVTSHPAGSHITVYYDPQVPSESTLLRGMSPFIWLGLISCIGFGVVAIATIASWPAAGAAQFLAKYPTKDLRNRT